QQVADGVAAVNASLRENGIELEVLPGGEIAISRAADLDDNELRALGLGGGPWLLVESPLTPSAGNFDNALRHLQARGHRVVLAHPERCPAFIREPERLAALVHAGMLTSITAGALVGRFGGTVERYAHELVRDGLVHNVASDAHDTRRRPPGLREVLDHARDDERDDRRLRPDPERRHQPFRNARLIESMVALTWPDTLLVATSSRCWTATRRPASLARRTLVSRRTRRP